MSLFSFLRKNKQESADDGSYYSHAEEASRATRKRKASTGSATDGLDPVLPEKKRARRRLVGAVALVLAAIIGLPMVLDSEPKPLAEDIAIQIPPRDSLPPVANRAPLDPAAALDENEEVVPDPPQAVTVPPPPPPPVAISKAAPAVAAPATTPNPTVEPRSSSSAPVRTAPAVRGDEGARALALLEGRPVPAQADKKQEKFVIQVAALASQEKVNELQGRLKRAGIASFTQKVATANGSATRIRVGPFASREQAEQVRARIVKLGLNGTLVPV